jgi:class 3 adenylate cyclase
MGFPSGLVTLLFTDIEGGIGLWEADREAMTDAQIAGRLFLSVNTVRSHLERIRDKTGARRRAELVRYAIQAGIDPAASST